MEKIIEAFMLVLFFVAVTFMFTAVLAYPTMLLWNWLMPVVFSTLPTISFWQAFGLMLLSRLLLPGGTTYKSSG